MVDPAEALVVDASVAVKWYLGDERYAQEALVLLERFSDGQLALFAPEQIRYEIPSAIAVATRLAQPRLSVELGRLAIEKFFATGITTINDDALVYAAYALVHEHSCALYDGLYLALAHRLQLPLIIADRRLHQRVGHLPNVIWIGEYAVQPDS